MSITSPAGFLAAGIHCGIKASGALDLALVATSDSQPASVAATFTQNLACAGPVRVSRRHLASSAGRSAAVILNSGNANCATGTDVAVAEEMCALTAKELGCAADEVLVCSTGLIGITLDPVPLRTGIPQLVAARSRSGSSDAAHAIMTTDTVAKEVSVTGDGWSIGGMAKGAAMLAPNMATMLAVLSTDAAVDQPLLQGALDAAVAQSFNRVVVDGCTSTNDTVILLANGAARATADTHSFAAALGEACRSLALQMVRDAEGHTKVVTVRIAGALDDAQADLAARKLATSLLVKCSLYGSDPYWGRILSDLGSCGVALDVDSVTIAYDDIVVSRGLAPTGADASDVVGRAEFSIHCDLGAGQASSWVWTNDLGHAYIDENMGTS